MITHLRPICVGKKNYLFAGSDEGAERAAVIYTVRKCSPNPTVQPPAPGARLAFAGAEQARRWEPS